MSRYSVSSSRNNHTVFLQLITVALVVLTLSGCANTKGEMSLTRTNIIPEGMGGLRQKFGASPVVKVGNLVWISGIAGHMPPGTTAEQMIEEVYRKIEAHLASAGATMSDVVDVDTFTTAKFRYFTEYQKIHAKHFNENPPAWSAFGVETLVDARLLLEVKVMAVIGSGRNATEVWPEGESMETDYPNFPSAEQVFTKYKQESGQ